MSAKKAWDIRPERVEPQPRPAPRSVDGIRPAPRLASSEAHLERKPKRPAPRRPLKERRRHERRRTLTVISASIGIVTVLILVALWLPQLRVSTVTAKGANADGVRAIAQQSLAGTYAFLIPRNSLFFLPTEDIRKKVLAAYPEVSTISITSSGFTAISVSSTARVEAFAWCGISIGSPQADGRCYDADTDGLIFRVTTSDASARFDLGTASSTSSVSTSTEASVPSASFISAASQLRVFAAVDRDASVADYPLKAKITNIMSIMQALRFVKAVRELGAPVSALSIRGDEADLWLPGPTRITYVLGQEASVTALAQSVLPGLSLTNGSVQYIDLRFPGKAYVKKYAQ